MTGTLQGRGKTLSAIHQSSSNNKPPLKNSVKTRGANVQTPGTVFYTSEYTVGLLLIGIGPDSGIKTLGF